MSPTEITLKQGAVTLTQTYYPNKAYPIWLIAASMDRQMYEETGMTLAVREWTAQAQAEKQ